MKNNGPPGLRRSAKPCQRCGLNYRLPGERYCSPCRVRVLWELGRSGYLERRHLDEPPQTDEPVPEIAQAAAGQSVPVRRPGPAAR